MSGRTSLTTLLGCGVALAAAACASPGSGRPVGDGAAVTFQDAGGGGGDATPTSCKVDGDCPAAAPRCAPGGVCLQCLIDTDCGAGAVCSEGLCVPATCAAGQAACAGNTALTCKADASGWDKLPCGAATCVGGQCTGCTPGAALCSGKQALTCRADGSGYDLTADCAPKSCLAGACVDCFPGALRCDGNIVQECGDSGWATKEDCNASGRNCVLGSCVSACFSDPKSLSNSGCDYWAVDLDNHPDAQDSPYAIVVANLSERTATVTIIDKDGAAVDATEVSTAGVAPGELHIFQLPPRNMGKAGTFWTGYRVQSTAPIVAYQFNPLDNVDVFSNDASLLIPANTFGKEYLVMSRFQFTGGGPDIPLGSSCAQVCGQIDGGECVFDGTDDVCQFPYRGTISVVAAGANTTVTVRPTARTAAGATMSAMVPGQSYEVTLEPFQVLNIRSDEEGADLTGTEIVADKPVGVFSGHMAALSGEKCCADHLEQMMFPVTTWGKTYVCTKSFPRNQESDYWRILAAEDGTVVQFEPGVAVNQALDRGEYFEFATTQDFKITATKPVLVAQILASAREAPGNSYCADAYDCGFDEFCATTQTCIRYCDSEFDTTSCGQGTICTCSDPTFCYCESVGDPALILAAPVEQFRQDYVFLTPNAYRDDYINVIAPAAAAVTLDGDAVPAGQFTAIPGSGYKVARLVVSDGVHTLSATDKVSVIAYGYDRHVSYGYAAGLNLNDL